MVLLAPMATRTNSASPCGQGPTKHLKKQSQTSSGGFLGIVSKTLMRMSDGLAMITRTTHDVVPVGTKKPNPFLMKCLEPQRASCSSRECQICSRKSTNLHSDYK